MSVPLIITSPLSGRRSEEHTSELQYGYISYAVFCLKKKKIVEMASAFYQTMVIQPDRDVFLRSQALDVPIRFGYFPDALKNGETLDAIVFNDVMSRMP